MTTLEVKIKNLVEGLDNVKKLADELHGVGDAAKTAGQSASAGKQGFTDLSNGAEQFRTLGIRSFSEIRAEINKVAQAYQQLEGSGKLSGGELQQVAIATKERLNELRGEIRGSSEGFEQFRTIGIRPFADIRAEIARVTQSYQQLAASGKLSATELQVAAAATASKVSALNAELKGNRDGLEQYRILGVRSHSEVKAEIVKVTQAYQQLVTSGKVSGTELQQVVSVTKDRLNALRNELNGSSESAENYRTIGIRSFSEIRAEITRVTQAHQQLMSSGKLSGSELQAVTSATREKLSALNAELKGTVTQNTEAASTGGMLGGALSKMTPQTAALSAGFELVKDNVGKLIGAFTALAIAYGLKESVEYAARTETLGITMGVVAKNAGYGSQEISKYEKEVKGLGITTQGTREAITQMIQAGLEIGPKAEGQVSQVAKLARAAQDLAVVTGESSSATLTRLITNISQLDTVGLRYMGLTVNVEAAEKAFAISVGKSAEQLTQKQKIQAVANEALVQAEKLQGAYEASMESVGKKVQSLKRYQEELANTIGDKLLPSYSALVDSVTRFLKDSERTVSSIDKTGAASRYLGEGVKEAADGLGSLFSSILNLGKEIYPTINGAVKAFLDLVGMLLKAIAVVISLGDHTEQTGKQITLLGFTINLIFLAIGGTLAVIKDSITLITALIYGLIGAVLSATGHIIVGFGKVIGFFKKDLGQALQETGKSIQETGQHMRGFAGETLSQFGRGESAVAKFGKSIKDSQKNLEDLKSVTNFSQAEAEVLKLVEAVRKAGVHTKEFAERGDALTSKLKEMRDAGSLTGQQFDELSKRIKRLSMDDAKALMAAVDEVGMKLTKLNEEDRLAPLNKEFGSAITLVVELGNSTKATAALMNDAFAKGVDTAKTLADLSQLGASIKDVARVTGDIKPTVTEATLKFEELFEKSLKAARTERDFNDLRQELNRLKDTGSVSAEAIGIAFDKLKEKITGAKEEAQRFSKQSLDEAKAATDIAKTHLGVIKAQQDEKRAELEIMVKQNAYYREGSKLAKEELELAKINKEIASARVKEAEAEHKIAVAARTQLIALQQKLNAEKELELKIGKEDEGIYRKKAQAAADYAESTEINLNKAKEELETHRGSVTQLEEKKLKQSFLVDQERTIVEEKRKQEEKTRKSIEDSQKLIDKLNEGANSTKLMADNAGALSDKLNTSSTAASNLASNLNKATTAAQNLSSAQSTPSGKNGGNPKGDIQVDGENLKYLSKDHYVDEKGIVVGENGKPSSTGSDGFGAGVTDAGVADLLWKWEHGEEIESTAENLQRAKTAYEAASANLEIYQKNPLAFANSGADSIMRSFNRARGLLERMRGGSLSLKREGNGFFGNTNSRGINGSHKDGLDRVPHDGYIAELHKDERVLTAKEANNYRNGMSIDDLSDALLSRVSSRAYQPPAMPELAKAKPTETIQLDLTANGKKVELTTAAENKDELLKLLKSAKGVYQ